MLQEPTGGRGPWTKLAVYRAYAQIALETEGVHSAPAATPSEPVPGSPGARRSPMRVRDIPDNLYVACEP